MKLASIGLDKLRTSVALTSPSRPRIYNSEFMQVAVNAIREYERSGVDDLDKMIGLMDVLATNLQAILSCADGDVALYLETVAPIVVRAVLQSSAADFPEHFVTNCNSFFSLDARVQPNCSDVECNPVVRKLLNCLGVPGNHGPRRLLGIALRTYANHNFDALVHELTSVCDICGAASALCVVSDAVLQLSLEDQYAKSCMFKFASGEAFTLIFRVLKDFASSHPSELDVSAHEFCSQTILLSLLVQLVPYCVLLEKGQYVLSSSLPDFLSILGEAMQLNSRGTQQIDASVPVGEESDHVKNIGVELSSLRVHGSLRVLKLLEHSQRHSDPQIFTSSQSPEDFRPKLDSSLTHSATCEKLHDFDVDFETSPQNFASDDTERFSVPLVGMPYSNNFHCTCGHIPFRVGTTGRVNFRNLNVLKNIGNLSRISSVTAIEYTLDLIYGTARFSYQTKLTAQGTLTTFKSQPVNEATNDHESSSTCGLQAPVPTYTFEEAELFQGLIVRRTDGVITNIRVVTSYRVTPWLLCAPEDDGHAIQNIETYHLDWASDCPPHIQRIPVCAAAAFDISGRMSELSFITFATTHSSYELLFTPTRAKELSIKQRVQVCVQLFQLLYALFPWRTLRWLRSRSQNSSTLPLNKPNKGRSCPCSSVLARLFVYSVCLHPQILEPPDKEFQAPSVEANVCSIIRDLAHTHIYSDVYSPICCYVREDGINNILTAPYSHDIFDRGAAVQDLVIRYISNHSHSNIPSPSLEKDASLGTEGTSSFEGNDADTIERKRSHTITLGESDKQIEEDRERSLSSAPSFSPMLPTSVLEDYVPRSHTSPARSRSQTNVSERIRELERDVAVLQAELSLEKVRNAQLSKRLRDAQDSLTERESALESEWATKLLDMTQKFDAQMHDEMKIEQTKWRREMTMKTMRNEMLQKKIGEENSALRLEISRIRDSEMSLQNRLEQVLTSQSLAEHSYASYLKLAQLHEEGLDAYEQLKRSISSAEQSIRAQVQLEFQDQLRMRDDLVKALVFKLHQHLDFDDAPGLSPASEQSSHQHIPISNDVLKKLLVSLQSRQTPDPIDINTSPSSFLPRSMSAGQMLANTKTSTSVDSKKDAECSPPNHMRVLSEQSLHTHARSRSQTPVRPRTPLSEGSSMNERIRHIEAELQQQTTAVEVAKAELNRSTSVHTAELRTLEQKERALRLVIVTLERRIIELLRQHPCPQFPEVPVPVKVDGCTQTEQGSHAFSRTHSQSRIDPDEYRPQDAHADLNTRTHIHTDTHTREHTQEDLNSSDENSDDGSSDMPYVRTPDIIPFGQQAHTPRPMRRNKSTDSCRTS